MSDDAAPQGAGALPADSTPSAPELPATFSDPSEAARVLSARSHQKRRQNEDAPDEASPDERQELPEDPSAQAEVLAEEAEAIEAAELPPIDPPKSWAQDQKERFASLPRETQEYLAQREAERDRLTFKSSNELSEQRKAMEAKAQELGQLRQHYEAQIPMAMQAIQAAILADFPDVRSPEDVARLAQQEPARYVQWDAKQKQLATWQSEWVGAQQRQYQEQMQQLNDWKSSQDSEVEKLFEKTPKAERDALANEAKAALLEYGFNEQQIGALWESSILRSVPLQRIMADAAKYRIAKRTATKPAAKPVPPVQRPGTVTPARNSAVEAEIKTLESKDSLTLNDATRLIELKAKRRAA